MTIRIGQGFDIHPLVLGEKLVLGGVLIPYEKGLVGHSDADVLVHAVCDALLGAARLDDIGQNFPDTDNSFQDIYSITLLTEVSKKLSKIGIKVVNIDATVILEGPKIAPYIGDMRDNISKALGLSPLDKSISVKATTAEKLGFIGRGEGIAALAVALVDILDDPKN